MWLAAYFLAATVAAAARDADLAFSCPEEPQAGSLSLQATDADRSTSCFPSTYDDVGSAIVSCWEMMVVDVGEGCRVKVSSALASASSSPDGDSSGAIPCSFFTLAGNLTGDGSSASMWAEVDGHGLLRHFQAQPQKLALLRYATPEELVIDVWAFMWDFMSDRRFDSIDWLEGYPAVDAIQPLDDAATAAARPQRSASWAAAAAARRLLATPLVAGGGAGTSVGTGLEASGSSSSVGGSKRSHLSKDASQLWRTSKHKLALKTPSGCKYKFRVDVASRVLTPPITEAAAAWQLVYQTVAVLAALTCSVGLVACIHFSKRHSEYLTSHYEYESLKTALAQDPATYAKVFGHAPEQPDQAASGASRQAAAAAAPPPAPHGSVAAVAAAGAAAMQPRPVAAQLAAEAGYATAHGAGEEDGVSSSCCSSSGNLGGLAAEVSRQPSLEGAEPGDQPLPATAAALLPPPAEGAGAAGQPAI